MAPNLGPLLACLLAATSIAGCSTSTLDVSAPDEGIIESTGPVTEPPPEVSPTEPTGTTTPGSTAPPVRQKPIVFSGHIDAPDPTVYDYGNCGANLARDTLRGVTWQQFVWDEDLTGWSFAFDVDGMVAYFPGTPGGSMPPSSGMVPPGSRAVSVCSPDEFDLDYNLTLTPPGSVVFSGHAYLPGAATLRSHCHGSYVLALDALVRPLTGASFALAQDYSNWTYTINVPDVFANFHAPGYDDFGSSHANTVPPGAYEVFVCLRAGADTDFQLMLTPPVV